MKIREQSKTIVYLNTIVYLLITFIGNNSALAFMTYTGGASIESDWQNDADETVLENFETYTAGTQLSSIPSLGLNIDQLSGGGYPQIYLYTETTPHGSKQLGNFPNGVNYINRWNSIVMHVQNGYQITAFGFWNGDGQADTLVAEVYDSNNILLGSIGAFKGRFAGCITEKAISKIIFKGDTGDGWNHLDGLQTNVKPSTIIISPNGGEVYQAGKTINVKWEANLSNDQNVVLEYSINNGQNWISIVTTENDGEYEWTLPILTSDQCLVQVYGEIDTNLSDASDNVFTIFECQLSSIADFNNDCIVDIFDFSLFAAEWLRNGNQFDDNFTEENPIQ